MNTLSRIITDYSSSVEFKDLTPEVIHEVKRRLIDSLGCAFGAYNSGPGKIGREIGKKVAGSATLIGTKYKTTPDIAAFSNGILIRYLDYNDTYLSKEPAHPSDNISAALAVGEAENSDGKTLINAITLGYEVQCRLCDAASLRAGGWDHVAYVSISSALLAAKLIGIDRERMEHAIALSIVPNIPVRQTRVGALSMWKGCAAANAARNGVFAALLAREGMTGPSQVFEGEMGLFNQVTGPFELNIDAFGGKGGEFKILDTYIKRHPSEYHSQAGVEAALKLRDEVDTGDIKEINIETYDACVDIIAGDKEKWHPKTRETADHSLPYCVAVALIDGKVGLEQFSEERIRDPELQSLLDKITVKRNSGHTRQYPNAFPCFIEIKTVSGRKFSRTVSYPKGHPKNPMSDKEVEEKFKVLGDGYIESKKIEEILNLIRNLENLKYIGDLMNLFRID